MATAGATSLPPTSERLQYNVLPILTIAQCTQCDNESVSRGDVIKYQVMRRCVVVRYSTNIDRLTVETFRPHATFMAS